MPAVIELDAPVAPRSGRRPRGAWVPSWLVVALVVVGVVALTGGGEGRRSLEPVFAAEFTLAPSLSFDGGVPGVLSTGHTLFVARISESLEVVIQAYRPVDGALLWSKGFGSRADLAYADDRSVVLFVGEWGTPDAAIVGLDAATGAIRWRRGGLNGTVVAAGVVLGESWSRPVRSDENPGRVARRVTAVSIVDGAVRWSGELPDGAFFEYRRNLGQSGTVTLVEIYPDGLVRERALASGIVVREVRAEVPGPPMDAMMFDDVAVLLSGEVGDRVASTVDLANGRLLWRRAGAVEGLVACGDVLCRTGDDRSVEVLDRRTGATLWRASGLSYMGDDRAHLLLGERPGEPTTVVEPRTGRVVRQLGRWQVVGWQVVGSRNGMLVRGVGRPASFVYGWLDVDSGAVTVLGVERRSLAAPYCEAGARYLVCAGGARLFAWTIDG